MDMTAREKPGLATDKDEDGEGLNVDVDAEAAVIDARVGNSVGVIGGGMGGPKSPRTGGKGKVFVHVSVVMAKTDIFAVGSKIPELAQEENEAK